MQVVELGRAGSLEGDVFEPGLHGGKVDSVGLPVGEDLLESASP